jgi:hypothetical protein
MKVTVKEKTENEIDWGKPQLVISKEGFIIQVSCIQKSSEDRCFSGQDLKSGLYSNDYVKSAFKKFNGTITIEQ